MSEHDLYDCNELDCEECSQHIANQKEEVEMAEHYGVIEDQEDREWQRQRDGGDDDDGDEEDLHGSHSIEEPDDVEEDEEE